jgi:hypothetical protein
MAAFSRDEQQRLQETVAGILNGKKMKEHRVVKHKWNFEPPKMLEVTRQGGTLRAKGRFTHYLKFVRDDVVTYEFTIAQGQVSDLKVNYEDRGWSEAVDAALEGVEFILGRDTSSLEDLNDRLGKTFDGDVDDEARIIVANRWPSS